MSTLGYKQTIEHINNLPNVKTKILNLSNLCRYECYGLDNKKKQDRYYFDVTVNGSGLLSAYKHVCYFDDKQVAEQSYKDLRLKLYDQETKPFLQKNSFKSFFNTKR